MKRPETMKVQAMSNDRELPVTKRETGGPRKAGQTRKPAPAGRKITSPHKSIIDIFRGEAMPAAEFRRICDNIGWTMNRGEKPGGPKKVLVTSSLTNEGKSTVAAFLALTSAVYFDQRTLLLDCDMRRPAVHRMFRESLPKGLSDCLAGAATFDTCVRTTAVEKLKILTAGTASGDPSDILTLDNWSELIAEASFYFDRIVIDCAPIIPVDDAVTIGRAVDGLLMVVRAGSTQREVARRATQIIYDSKLNLLGVILNNLDNALPYYYNRDYYSYRYKRGPS